MLKNAAGVLLCAAGVAAGVYCGVAWALVGGIVLAVHAFQASPVNTGDAVWGIVRACLFETIGLGACLVLFLPGVALMSD